MTKIKFQQVYRVGCNNILRQYQYMVQETVYVNGGRGWVDVTGFSNFWTENAYFVRLSPISAYFWLFCLFQGIFAHFTPTPSFIQPLSISYGRVVSQQRPQLLSNGSQGSIKKAGFGLPFHWGFSLIKNKILKICIRPSAQPEISKEGCE